MKIYYSYVTIGEKKNKFRTVPGFKYFLGNFGTYLLNIRADYCTGGENQLKSCMCKYEKMTVIQSPQIQRFTEYM